MDAALLRDGRIRIIGGRAGVGKSEFSANYALKLHALGLAPTLVDLDVVNPYFTTREQRRMFEARGVSVIGPSDRMTVNDVPAIPPEVNRIFLENGGPVVVDLGGDVAGARAFGPWVKRLRPGEHEFFMLVNANRPYHESAAEVLAFWWNYEAMTGMRVSGIVNNTHLLQEADEEGLRRGEQLCRELRRRAGVPYRYLVVPEGREADPGVSTEAQSVFGVTQYLRPLWLR